MDKRVVAIVPIVIDLLNVVPSFKHHWAAYGFWAPAVGDYEAMGIMNLRSVHQALGGGAPTPTGIIVLVTAASLALKNDDPALRAQAAASLREPLEDVEDDIA